MAYDYQDYFDGDGKQTKQFPKKWIDASRFKVGDRIEYLEDWVVSFLRPEYRGHKQRRRTHPSDHFESRNLKSQVGVVLRVNNGHSHFPSRWIADDSDEGGTWLTDMHGWLTVRFPFDLYGFEDDQITFKPRACLLEDEGVDWRLVRAP